MSTPPFGSAPFGSAPFGSPPPEPAEDVELDDLDEAPRRSRALVAGLAAAAALVLAGAVAHLVLDTGETPAAVPPAPVASVAPAPGATPTASPTRAVSAVRNPFEPLVTEAPQPAADTAAGPSTAGPSSADLSSADPSTTWPPPGTDPATLTDKGPGATTPTATSSPVVTTPVRSRATSTVTVTRTQQPPRATATADPGATSAAPATLSVTYHGDAGADGRDRGSFFVSTQDDGGKADFAPGDAFGDAAPHSELVFLSQADDRSSAVVRFRGRDTTLAVGRTTELS